MRYSELLEGKSQTDDIIKIAEALVQFVVNVVKEAYELYDESGGMGYAYYGKSMNGERPFINRLDLTTDQKYEVWEEMVSCIDNILLGKTGKKKRSPLERTQLEFGKISDLLQRVNFDNATVDASTLKALGDVYIVMNDTDNVGRYDPNGDGTGARAVVLGGGFFITNRRVAVKQLAKVVAHELTHAYDHSVIGDEFEGKGSRGAEYYMQHNFEVNARFTELVLIMKHKIVKDPKLKERDAFVAELKTTMQRYRMDVSKKDIKPQQSNQVIKRIMQQFKFL